MTQEREFMAYCDRYGQRLDWEESQKRESYLSGTPLTRICPNSSTFPL